MYQNISVISLNIVIEFFIKYSYRIPYQVNPDIQTFGFKLRGRSLCKCRTVRNHPPQFTMKTFLWQRNLSVLEQGGNLRTVTVCLSAAPKPSEGLPLPQIRNSFSTAAQIKPPVNGRMCRLFCDDVLVNN